VDLDYNYVGSVDREVMLNTFFRSLFILLSVTLEHALQTYTREHLLRSLADDAFARQLAPMLLVNATTSPDTLIGRAWEIVEGLIALTGSESDFLSLAESGELRGELPFPDDPTLAERLAAHPALLWKMANVRAHRGASVSP
jgi:hypothetical protein